MFSVVYNCYELLSELLPFLAVMYVLRKREGGEWNLLRDGLLLLFALYVMAVYHVTGAGTIHEAIDWKFRFFGERVNLLPFSNEINGVGYALNVVMVMPFGFLVPLLWKKCSKLSHILLAGGSFSLLIELSQLLSYRGTDVDDLIMNTLGAFAGFLIYKVWDRVTKSRFQFDLPLRELPGTVLSLYLGRCLLYNALGFIDLWERFGLSF